MMMSNNNKILPQSNLDAGAPMLKFQQKPAKALPLKVFVETYGWPLVQVPYDNFGDIKDAKWCWIIYLKQERKNNE